MDTSLIKLLTSGFIVGFVIIQFGHNEHKADTENTMFYFRIIILDWVYILLEPVSGQDMDIKSPCAPFGRGILGGGSVNNGKINKLAVEDDHGLTLNWVINFQKIKS